jgi:hypothetical protein
MASLVTTTINGTLTGNSSATFDGRVQSNNQLRVSNDYSVNYFYKTNNTTVLGYLLMRDDNNSFLSFPAAQDFRFLHGNTSRIAVKTDGNVGIGTTSPSQKLHVNGTIKAGIAGNSSANTPALLVASAGTSPQQSAIAIQQNTTEGDTIIFADYEPYVEWGLSTDNGLNTIEFTAGSNTNSLANKTLYNQSGNARTAYKKVIVELGSGNMLVGGNVGIGVTSPGYKLDVNGDVRAGTIRLESGGDGVMRNFSSSGTLTVYGGNLNTGGAIKLYARNHPSEPKAVELLTNNQTRLVARSSELVINEDNNNYDFRVEGQTDDDLLKCDASTDSVGIGGSPNSSYKLDVSGDTLIQESESGDLKLVVNNVSTSTLARSDVSLINNTGSAAGLTLPSTTYTLVTGWANRLILNTDSNISNGILVRPSAGGFTVSANGLANTNLRVDTTGNVGVNTASPSAKLQVKAAISTVYANVAPSVSNSIIAISNTQTSETTNDQAQIQFGVNGGTYNRVGSIGLIAESASNRKAALVFATDDAGTRAEKMRITGEGKVGIGTTSPDAKLHIKDSTNPPEIRFEDVAGGTQTAKIVYDQAGQNKLVLSTQYQSSTDLNLIQFAPADNVAMTIRGGTGTSDGFVGIGTTSPAEKLHIGSGASETTNSFVRVDGNASKQKGFNIYGDGTEQWRIYTSASSSDLRFYDGSNVAVTFEDGGNVGIGNTNPQGTLDLGNATGGKSIVWGGTSGTNHYTSIWSEYGTGSLVLAGGLKSSTTDANFIYPYTGTYGYAAIELDSFSDDGIKFYTAADAARTAGTVATKQERMRIDTSGKVGIGTTSPNHELEVAGSGDATIRITSTSTNINNEARIGTLQYFSSDTTSNTVVGEIVSRIPVGNFGNIFDMAFSTYKVNSGALSEKMRITGIGNVGIGTASPDSKLHLHEAATAPSLLTLHNSVADILNDGSTGNFIDFKSTDANATFTPQARIGMVVQDQAGDSGIASEGHGNFVVYTAVGTDALGNGTLTEKLRVNHDGNVGIGTPSPKSPLTVQSDASANSIQIYGRASDDAGDIDFFGNNQTTRKARIFIDSNGFNISGQASGASNFIINSSGNVGIGVTNPNTYKLEVAGPVYSASYYATNTSSSFQKLSVYGNGGTYGIGMVAGITYGALNDWAMTFRFNSESDRGFWWGDTSHSTAQGAMSLTTHGYLTVANKFKVGGGETDTSGPSHLLHVEGGSGAAGIPVAWIHNSGNATGYDGTVISTVNDGADAEVLHVRTNNTTYNGGTSLMLVQGDGNVGIGTTSPTAKIHVKDDSGSPTGLAAIIDRPNNLAAVDQTADNPELLISGHSSNYKLVIRDHSSNELMVVKGDGSVGIGTTAPGNHKLKVAGETHSTHFITGYDWTAKTGGLHIGNDGLTTGAVSFYNGSNSSANIYRNSDILYVGARAGVNTRGLAIIANGNVGIGTNIPVTELHLYTDTTGARNAPIDVLTLETEHTSDVEYNGFGQGIVFRGSTYNQNSQRTLGRILHQINDDSGNTTRGTSMSFQTSDNGANANAPTTKVTIDYKGDFGIGTVSPGYKLDVVEVGGVASARIRSTNANVARLFLSNTVGTWRLYSAAASNSFRIFSDSLNDDAFVIKSDGKVGIGTTDPNNPLHIQHSGSTTNQALYIHNTSNGDDAGIKFSDVTGATQNGIFYYTHSDAASNGTENSFHFNSDQTNLAVIVDQTNGNSGYYIGESSPVVAIRGGGDSFFNGGNVGIGTSAPKNKLTITDGATPYTTANILLQIKRNASNGNDDTSKASIFLTNNSNGFQIAYGGTSDRLRFINGGDVEMVTFKNGGNVGIGSTDPGYKLDVNAGLSAGGGITYPIRAGHGSMGDTGDGVGILFNRGNAEQYNGYVRIQSTQSNPNYLNPRLEFGIQDTDTFNLSAASTRMVITGAGLVGIGTTSPGSYFGSGNTLVIANTASSAGITIVSNAANSGNIYFSDGTSGSDRTRGLVGYNHAANYMVFHTDAAEAMRIDSSGNVGIGTNNPLFKLHVNGDIYQDTGYSIYSNANRGWYRGNYTTTGSGVSNGKIVTLNPSHGQTASNVYHYIFELTTIGTSTDTGATYIGVYSANASAWSLRAVSLSGGSSNHPQLSVSGNNFTVYTNHSGNYTVVVSVTTVYNGDADSTAHSLGANYQWQRAVNDLYYNDGLVGIGTGTPSQKLHVQGNLRVTGAFYDSNNVAGASGQVLTSTGSATDWKDLDEISGVTASNPTTTNYVTKWSDGTNEVITDSLIYDNGTNVGISTANPSAKLHVHSTTGILHTGDDFSSWVLKYLSNQSASSTTVNYYLIAAKTQTNVRLDGVLKGARSAGVSANSGGGTRILFNTNNATTPLAIGGLESWGTDNPSYGHPIFTIVELTYNAVEYYALRISPSSNWVASFNHVQFEGIANNVLFTNVGAGDVSNILGFSGSESVFSYQHGNLGIGTGSPSQKLHVNGTIKAGIAGNSSANTPALLVASAGTSPEQSAIAIQQSTNTGDTIIFADYEPYVEYGLSTDNGLDTIEFTGGTTTNNLGSKTLYNQSGNARTAYKKVIVELLSGNMLVGGNVGIGTTSPSDKLHVVQNTDLNTALFQNTSGRAQVIIDSQSTTHNSYLSLSNGGSEFAFLDALVSANLLRIATNNTGAEIAIETNSQDEAVRIDSSGNVGIGTPSPEEKLHVNGNVRGDSFGSEQNTTSRIFSPQGATYNGSGSQTGYLIVKLPDNGATGINNMMSGVIRVFDYTTHESFDVHFAGYWYSGYNWTNQTAWIENSPHADRNFKVRFGKLTGTSGSEDRPFITIGESDSTWSYVKFSVVTYTAGHSNVDLEKWNSGWATSVSASLPGTVLRAASNTQANNWTRNDGEVYYNTGNVGIGTDNPTGKLQIGGSYTIDSNFGGNDIYIKSTSGRTSYDPNIYNTDDFGALITISDSNTVGPTKPGLVLYNDDVTAGGFSPMLLFSKRETGSSPYKATMAAIYARSPLGTGVSNGWIDGELIFATAGAASQGVKQRMVINKEGLVGIGTASPSQALNIVRSDASGSAEFDLYSTNSLKQPMLTFKKSASNTIGTKSVTPDGSELGEIEFIGVNTGSNFAVKSVSILGLQDGTAGATYIPGALTFGTGTNAAAVSERMRIDSSGDVGIGTTSPITKLDVTGAVQATFGHFTGWAVSGNKGAGLGLDVGISSGDGYVLAYDRTGGTGYADLRLVSNASQIHLSNVAGGAIEMSGKVGIGTGTPSQKLHVQGNLRLTGAFYDSNNAAGTSGQVLTSTGSATDWKDLDQIATTPNAPASASATIVGETVDVTFTASTTSNIDAYLVYSSIDGSDYGLISVIPPEDFSSSMSVIDNSFDETGTQAYRVYAMKLGVLSSAATASVSYTVSSAEPTSMNVVDLNNAFYVQWNPPSSNERFVTAYNVYKDENAVQASLSRSNATLIYSGLNTNYMYQINGTNNNNFHQFWVETTIA